MKKLLILLSLLTWAFLGQAVFAEDAPPVYISAFNAGFKDDIAAQNYDFVELSRVGQDDIPLAGLELRYFNSSGNLAGTIGFSDN